jgi:serine O-acetyltransferase
MKLSLTKADLCSYIVAQINNFFPDKYSIKNEINGIFDIAVSRLEFCFRHVALKQYNDGQNILYNHLYSDHNVMFLWFLSNTVWKELQNDNLASKLYYLNKTLHGLDCMYDTALPNVFLIFHSVGTMLGKALYDEYFIVLQGATIGSHHGEYPILGKGVAFAAHSSAIGKCHIGDRATISVCTTIFKKDIPSDHTAIMNFETGTLKINQSDKCYAQQFFNVDLKNEK